MEEIINPQETSSSIVKILHRHIIKEYSMKREGGRGRKGGGRERGREGRE